MKVMTVGANNYTITIGWLIALLVLFVDVVLMVIGQMELRLGLMIAGLAVARLI